ncbi:aminoglycoside 6-adenylyltransferase [Mycolicibacterium nivoides]|uniref:Aminoglycoside 6-adenylyltransferase n=1 Tax=Mycolicibacterium nivoides TaxID=2487344 RepID=A0ABW9LKC0_9MYCO
MEYAAEVLNRIVAFASAHDGIEAVIQTGSRARNQRVDRFSDLDIELVGPAVPALAGDDGWAAPLGDQLVSIHLANEEDDAPDWPTYLVVLAGGRKIDLTLAGPERITRMIDGGLDALYQRGYLVLLDKAGVTADLPTPTGPPTGARPTESEFVSNQREFWFEATQIPIYIARGDLWPAHLRLEELRSLLLAVLEWHARSLRADPVDTWHNGHHIDEWLAPAYHGRFPELFALYTRQDLTRALHATTELYAHAVAEIAASHPLPDLGLLPAVTEHISRVLQPYTAVQ